MDVVFEVGVLDFPDTVNVAANVGVWDIASTFGFDDIALAILTANIKDARGENTILILLCHC